MVANGQLEAPIATVELQFEVGDNQRKVHSNDKSHKPFNWSPILTTQQYHTRHASRNPELSLLFNAIEK